MSDKNNQDSTGEASPYAVVKMDGRAKRVRTGERLRIQQSIENSAPDSEITFSEVLLARKEKGAGLVVGNPIIDKAKVTAKVIGEVAGKKMVAFKRIRRHGFMKKIGSRPKFVEIEITGIDCP